MSWNIQANAWDPLTFISNGPLQRIKLGPWGLMESLSSFKINSFFMCFINIISLQKGEHTIPVHFKQHSLCWYSGCSLNNVNTFNTLKLNKQCKQSIRFSIAIKYFVRWLVSNLQMEFCIFFEAATQINYSAKKVGCVY